MDVFFGVSTFAFRLLVYLKSMYTRLVVVVNVGIFLWISLEKCTESTTCSRYKPVNDFVWGW
jgi:hypothetical protein